MIIEWTYGAYFQGQRYFGFGLADNISGNPGYSWSYDAVTGLVTITVAVGGTYIIGPIIGQGSGSVFLRRR